METPKHEPGLRSTGRILNTMRAIATSKRPYILGSAPGWDIDCFRVPAALRCSCPSWRQKNILPISIASVIAALQPNSKGPRRTANPQLPCLKDLLVSIRQYLARSRVLDDFMLFLHAISESSNLRPVRSVESSGSLIRASRKPTVTVRPGRCMQMPPRIFLARREGG